MANINAYDSDYKEIQKTVLAFYDLNKKSSKYCDISNKFQKLYSQTAYYIDCLEMIENEAEVSIINNYIENILLSYYL